MYNNNIKRFQTQRKYQSPIPTVFIRHSIALKIMRDNTFKGLFADKKYKSGFYFLWELKIDLSKTVLCTIS